MKDSDKLNIQIIGKTFSIHQSHEGNISESDYESIWGDKYELKLDGSQMWTFDCKQNKHKKVYSSTILTSFPPQYPWICEFCGYRGADRDMIDYNPTYEQLMKKFYGSKE
jgi:hypothetical protein